MFFRYWITATPGFRYCLMAVNVSYSVSHFQVNAHTHTPPHIPTHPFQQSNTFFSGTWNTSSFFFEWLSKTAIWDAAFSSFALQVWKVYSLLLTFDSWLEKRSDLGALLLQHLFCYCYSSVLFLLVLYSNVNVVLTVKTKLYGYAEGTNSLEYGSSL